jgi:hypothetical protein
VDLIDEQDGALGRLIAREAQDVADLGHIGEHRIDTHKAAAGLCSNDFSERSFATARRTAKNQAAEVVRLNQAWQQAVRTYDMLLPDQLIQSARAHAHCKRARRRRRRAGVSTRK